MVILQSKAIDDSGAEGLAAPRELAFLVSNFVKKEMIKGSQELLDKTNLWRFKTYYIFPLIEKLRFLDLGSRVVFPVAYIIFILVTMARVNFGYDHYALLRPTDVSALATSISECYCKQTADDYCASRGL